jgi:hypothetical protein
VISERHGLRLADMDRLYSSKAIRRRVERERAKQCSRSFLWLTLSKLGAAMPSAVPIRVVDEYGMPVPGMVAVFYWLEPSGRIAKVVEYVPIQNGVARYNGGPVPEGAFFGVTVHEGSGLPVFRSGRLNKLPGPPSEVAANSKINVLRSSVAAHFGLNSPDGSPELIRQSLSRLPSRLRIEEVRLDADNEGHEVVNVQGWVRRFFRSAPFNYSLALKLRIASEPGHPEDVILIEPARPGISTGAILGEVAIRHIASLQHLIRGTDFPATLVSLTSLTVVASHWDPSISMLVHGGTISGITEELIARD